MTSSAITPAARPDATGSPAHRPRHADARARTRTLRGTIERRFVEPPAWVVLLQLFVGLGWLRAVAEKVIDGDWWSGAVIQTFIADNAEATLGWYQPVTDLVLEPAAPYVAVVVVVAQVAAATSLLTGRKLGWGLGIGVFLNVNFVLVGAVTPSVFYLLAQMALALYVLEYRVGCTDALERLDRLATLGLWTAAAAAPSISTFDPALVIEDPGMMLTFFGLLVAAAAHLASHRWELRRRAEAAGWVQPGDWRYWYE